MDPKSTHPHARATTIGRVIGLFYGSTREKGLDSPRSNAETPDTDDPVSDHHPREPNPSFLPSSFPRHSAATRIGQYVTIGTCSSISSAVVEDNVLVGARSVLGSGSYVEANAALEAGTVVEPGQLIPSGQLWGGNPARYVRDLDGNEVLEIQTIAKNVYGVAADHADQQTPWGLDYVQAEALRRALGRE